MTGTDSPRWDVELSDGDFHDVGAFECQVIGGALVFYDRDGRVLVAYSASRWTAVSAE